MSTKMSELDLAIALSQIEASEKAQRRAAEAAAEAAALYQALRESTSAQPNVSENGKGAAVAKNNASPAAHNHVESKTDHDQAATALKVNRLALLEKEAEAARKRKLSEERMAREALVPILESKRVVEKNAVAKSDVEIAQRLHKDLNPAGNANALHLKEDTSNDAVIAQVYQHEGKEQAEPQFEAKDQVEQDETLVHALQELEGGHDHLQITKQLLTQFANARTKRGKLKAEERAKILADLQNILNSPAVVGDPIDPKKPAPLMDAHKYTKTLIRDGIKVLFGIDKQCQLSDHSQTPEQVLKEVFDFLGKLSVLPERVLIENIKGTFARIAKEPAVEAIETLANAHHVLSAAWLLAKKWGPEYMGAIATCLSDNIGDKGGCIAGLIARLYTPYAKMVGLELGLNSVHPEQQPAPANNNAQNGAKKA